MKLLEDDEDAGDRVSAVYARWIMSFDFCF
jgi:hypothetical protein